MNNAVARINFDRTEIAVIVSFSMNEKFTDDRYFTDTGSWVGLGKL